jgi:DNA invertase Pin-like site-specific DNA recombinase
MKQRLPDDFQQLKGLRARGLIRESTVEQGDNSGPVVQQRDIEAFAQRYGMTGPDRFYTDLVSGSDASKRPQFQQMVADAKAGLFDVLLVRETSRFARNRREAGWYEMELHKAGVVVAYTADNHLSTDRSAQIPLAVRQAVDEEYRAKLIDNVRLGYRVNRFERGKFSGTVPLGYVMGYEDVYIPAKRGTERRETGRLLVDDEPRPRIGHGDTYTNAKLVRLIGDMYATGQRGTRALAAELNRLGYRNHSGSPFPGGTLRHIIENPIYAGYLGWHHRSDKRPKDEQAVLVQGSHEPLWPPELWDRIRAVRARNFTGTKGGRLTYLYPLRRITRCDACGGRFFGERHRRVPYMACQSQREHKGCDQRAVKSAELEGQVAAWLHTLRIPDDWQADIERMQGRIAAANGQHPPVDDAKIRGQLDRLQELFFMGDISREEYVGRKRSLQESLANGRPQPLYSEAVLVKAARLLRDLGEL